jgi:DNA-binding beta-propeller fold protein YncE
MEFPAGVAVDSAGNVFVVARGERKVVSFDKQGKLRAQWGPELEGGKEFAIPWAICVDRRGAVYVVDSKTAEVFKFDPNGKLLSSWSLPDKDKELPDPERIAVEPSGNILIVDAKNDRVNRYDPSGKLLKRWGSKGREDGQFDFPCGVAVDKSGNIFVSEVSNHRVQKFDSTGRFLLKWGTEGPMRGQFDCPKDMAVDSKGNLFVVDEQNDRIQKFDSNGKFLAEVGEKSGELHEPTGVAVDSAGNVYVADFLENRIQKYRLEGAETPPETTEEAPPETTEEVAPEPEKVVRPAEKRKLSVEDVALLKELGIAEETILKKVQDSGTVFSEKEVEKLKAAGLSDELVAKFPKAGKAKPKLTGDNILMLHELGLSEESMLKKIEETASTFSTEEIGQFKKAGLSEDFVGKLTVTETKTATKEMKPEKKEVKEEPQEGGIAGSWRLKAAGLDVSLVLGEDGKFSQHYESEDEVENMKGTWKQRDNETIEVKDENNPESLLIPCKLIDADTLQVSVGGVTVQFKREN